MNKSITTGGSLLFSLLMTGNPALADGYTDGLHVLMHNVYMLSTNLYPNWGQNQRATLIAQADYLKNQDVVILNEAFDNTASATLLSGLAGQYPHQTPVLGRSKTGWNATLGAYSSMTPEDGGVAIVSKWPIEEKVQFVYSAGCGADALSNKGFVYVRINRNGQRYHIVGTHVQAQDSSCSAGQPESVRQQQFTNIRDFLAGKGIPANEMVLIGGDMNVVRTSPEYAAMLTALDVNAPSAYVGVDYTWDPRSNGIANYNYPTAAREYLDYILVARNYAQPSFWQNQARDVVSPRWEVSGGVERYQFKDYSDHYPVAAFAKADAATPTRSFKPVNARYGNVAIESSVNNLALRTGSTPTAWITATGNSANLDSRWQVRNFSYPQTGCLQTGDMIEVESRKNPGYLWNWWLGGGGGNYAYYPKQGDSSNRLRIENLSRAASECLQDGDQVAFRDTSTVSGLDYYLKRWDSGSWANHLYLWSSGIGAAEKFRVKGVAVPVYQAFGGLRY